MGIWSLETRNISLSYGLKYVLISWTIIRDSWVWQTDRRTLWEKGCTSLHYTVQPKINLPVAKMISVMQKVLVLFKEHRVVFIVCFWFWLLSFFWWQRHCVCESSSRLFFVHPSYISYCLFYVTRYLRTLWTDFNEMWYKYSPCE